MRLRALVESEQGRFVARDRYRLISLLELMNRFQVETLFALATKLGLLQGAWDSPVARESVSDSSLQSLLEEYLAACRLCGLRTSGEIAQRVRRELPPHATVGELEQVTRELARVMEAELSGTTFLWVPPDRARYLEDHTGLFFGEMGDLGYDKAQRDFDEARKCLGCSRPTAAVFHLMRVVEVGLRTLAVTFGLTLNLDQANWNTVLNHLEKEGPRHPKWQTAPEQCFGFVTHLRQIKTAFRNPCMHVPDSYTEEEAEEIYSLVRAFMRKLAEIAPGDGLRF